MMRMHLFSALWAGCPGRLGRAFRLVLALAAALTLSTGVGQAGDGLQGELYVVGSHEPERIERIDFNYNGQNFKVARLRKSYDLSASGDAQARLNSLLIPKSTRQRRQIQSVTSDASGAFSVPEKSGGATLRIEMESWEEVTQQSATPEIAQIGGVLTGDDISLSHAAIEADGSAYYFGEDAEDGSTFGEIDLDTNATTRLLEGLPLAEDVVDDPSSGWWRA